MQSQYYPLQFFDDLILKDGREKLWNEFLPYPEEVASGSIMFDSKSGTKKYLYPKYGHHHVEEVTEDFLEHFFIPKLKVECSSLRERIIDFCYKNSEVNQKPYFKETYRQLNYLRDRAPQKISSPNEVATVLRFLGYIEKYVGNVYHPKPRKAPINNLVSFSLYPKIKEHHLKSILVDLNNHLDNGLVSQPIEDLLQILTSQNIHSGGSRIVFTCKTVEAAYIFSKMFGYIRNLTWKSIEDSQVFYSYKNKLITANSLSKALNVYNNKDQKQMIDSIFNRFLN